MKFIHSGLLILLLLSSGGSGLLPAGTDSSGDRPVEMRAVAILVLDPLDDPEQVKERFRQLLDELRPSLPPGLHREENRRQIDAVLAADWNSTSPLPRIDLVFPGEMTPEGLYRLILSTPIAQESREVCPVSCPLRDFQENGIHIHLTQPVGGPGDSILVVQVFEPQDTAQDPVGLALQLDETVKARYTELGYRRKPIGKIFGVGVVVGNPKVGEEGMPPAISPG